MDASAFGPNSPGELVSTLEGARAFSPAPLPPKIDLNEIGLKYADAMQAVGELKGACRRLPNPWVLIRPLQRHEALTSSAMEGTFTTEDALLLAEAGQSIVDDESTREVSNYLRALSMALEMVKTLPISHRVIKAAHEALLSGLSSRRGAQKRPGEYKQEQNWIGGTTVEKARYVPPPPGIALKAMDDLERYINRADQSFPPPLIDLALVHYQLEAIHPFADGNGRVGRMLISLMAQHSGLLEMPVLYLSPVLESRKDEYIDLMFGVSARGDWTSWFGFFFDRVSESCHETVGVIDSLIETQSTMREIVGKESRSASAAGLVDFLIERPAVTVTEAATKLGVTYAAARSTVSKFESLGFLIPMANTYPQVYFSPQIVRATRPPEIAQRPSSSAGIRAGP
jgi:Fic family protein